VVSWNVAQGSLPGSPRTPPPTEPNGLVSVS